MEISLRPGPEEFLQLARRGNVIPVYADVLADGNTPVTAFRKLDDGGPSFLFESAELKEGSGRYSFLGFQPHLIVQGHGESDPLLQLEAVMQKYRFVDDPTLPRFAGGAVGYLGYEAIASFERTVPRAKRDNLQLPQMIFMIMNLLVVFDHRERRMKLIVNAFVQNESEAAKTYTQAKELIAKTLQQLSSACELRHIDAQRPTTATPVESNMSREKFESAVKVAKQHIVAGDIFQVVLSQRFQAEFKGDPLDLYRCLRLVNPSPYMFCLRFGSEFSLVGSSPELHVRVMDKVVELRPIAGTRRRGLTPEADERNAAELLADAKERAEHVMLVDLARNDLGRIAEYGSVKVTEQMIVERYSHVMHLVSHVKAKLAGDKSAYDVMRATFPAGTVSGAPKIRAMQIISELEGEMRGCYAGAVGYFGFDGALDSCIALRSAVVKDGRAYVQAGAGIVADSTPAAEYEETVSKATAILHALARAAEM